jgi:hypothetical protein
MVIDAVFLDFPSFPKNWFQRSYIVLNRIAVGCYSKVSTEVNLFADDTLLSKAANNVTDYIQKACQNG